ncbi:MAG: hypothetical protein N2110_07030 [Flavobacteriales bacterium]|nr:hypothetical protein [Flavobacteriales bacterium]
MLSRLILAVARLPWPVLRVLAASLAFLMAHLVRYRRGVILHNLRICFPEKTERWRRATMHNFYRHFAMVLMESIKILAMKKEDLIRRVQVENPEFFKPFREKGISGLMLGAHLGNWEWAGIRGSHLSGMTNLAVYFHLKNPEADQIVNKTRRRLSNVGYVVTPRNLYRTIMSAPKPCWTYLLADQSPSREHHVRVPFFGRETAFYDGPPRIARRLSLAVGYLHCERLGFGRFKIRFVLLAEDVSALTDQQLMAAYAKQLEEDIRHAPAHWLWSHRRWKF